MPIQASMYFLFFAFVLPLKDGKEVNMYISAPGFIAKNNQIKFRIKTLLIYLRGVKLDRQIDENILSPITRIHRGNMAKYSQHAFWRCRCLFYTIRKI